MKDVFEAIREWRASGRRYATATVTRTWGSSPRQVGSMMAVREDGLIVGSVSGGCVETSVVEEAQAAMQRGTPKLLVFGALSELNYWDVGLSCGGTIHVHVEPEWTELEDWRRLEEAVLSDRPAVVRTQMDPEAWSHRLLDKGALPPEAAAAYSRRTSAEAEDGKTFFHVFPQRERLLIVGAVHIAVPLVKFAKELGFETVVVDPRETFAQAERFSVPPDGIKVGWPEKVLTETPLTEDTYCVVLSHDPKIDDVALGLFLRSPVPYIGALGSRTTQAKRSADLIAQGFSEEDISRIHGPVGLAINARTPEEIALAIIAEIVQVKRGRG